MRVSEPRSARVPAGERLRWAGPRVGRMESEPSPLVFRWLCLESHKLPKWLVARAREGWDLHGQEMEGRAVAF